MFSFPTYTTSVCLHNLYSSRLFHSVCRLVSVYSSCAGSILPSDSVKHSGETNFYLCVCPFGWNPFSDCLICLSLFMVPCGVGLRQKEERMDECMDRWLCGWEKLKDTKNQYKTIKMHPQSKKMDGTYCNTCVCNLEAVVASCTVSHLLMIWDCFIVLWGI